MDLPRGPRREPVRVRDRDYEINGNQSRVLATVGAFRVVSSRDLEASLGRAGNPRSPDLRHLRESRARSDGAAAGTQRPCRDADGAGT